MALFKVINDNSTVILDANIGNLAVVNSGVAPGAYPGSITSGLVATSGANAETDNFKWWHFDVPTSFANYGLRLYDANGKLLYCATTQTARVVDAYQIGMWGAAPSVRNFPAGRDYAIMLSGMQFTEVQLRGAGMHQSYRILRWNNFGEVNGYTITTGWRYTLIRDWTPVPPEGQPSFPGPAYNPWAIILDVTGY